MDILAPKKQKKACYVVVQRTFSIGGIETMVLRLAGSILSNGDAMVVCGDRGQLSEMLPSGVDLFTVRRGYDLFAALPKHLLAQHSDCDIVLVSLHPWQLAVACGLRYRIEACGFDSVRSFHLVTHSRAFFFGRSGVVKDFLKRVFFSAPRESIFFMNDAARAAHANEWGRDLSGYGVLRLPLATSQPATWRPTISPILRVVSVGRLVAFKAYNRAASAIARQMLDDGIQLEWDIWGTGEDEQFILQEIKRNDVEANVRLKGELPYKDFHAVVAKSDVFVGMGTAVLEAAQTGMPAICAIDDGGDSCYGFLFQTPSDSVGDVVHGTPTLPIEEVLREFACKGEAERAEIGRACADSVLARSDGIEEFAAKIRAAPEWPVQPDPAGLALAVGSAAMYLLADAGTHPAVQAMKHWAGKFRQTT